MTRVAHERHFKPSRPSVKPTETSAPLAGDNGVRLSHPSFAQIQANRVTGHLIPYGSPLEVHGYISIKLMRSTEHRSNISNHYFAGPEMFDVCLTEMQWAQFVSGLNTGSGTPCTINHTIKGTEIERPPYIDRDNDYERTAREIGERARSSIKPVREAVDALDALIAGKGKATKTDLQELRGKFVQMIDHAASNAEFQANRMTEHLDEVVGHAKREVDAYVMRALLQHPQLETTMPSVPMLEKPEE